MADQNRRATRLGVGAVPRPTGLAVVVPAKDEAEPIAATIEAARAIAGVSAVVVVDDGSSDATGERAAAAGAAVVRHPRNRGKAAAMATGAQHVLALESAAGPADGHWALLFLDADLEGSAAATAVLAEPVLAGETDMTIAILPPQNAPGGGRGLVVGLSRSGIESLTGWTPTQPLSGMRCLSREAFEAAKPLAHGWGVETGLTIDLLTQGYRIREVPCELHHRVTGTDLAANLHRGRQYRDVALAIAARRARRPARKAKLAATVAGRIGKSLAGQAGQARQGSR